MHAPRILQPPHLQRQKLRLGDFRNHPHQFFLHQLMRSNRFVVELLALLRVIQCRIVTSHGPSDPATPGSKFDAGILQSVIAKPEVTEARSEYFPCTSQALYPGMPFSTRNPRITSSSHFAQITATSAIDPLVIHIFSPFKM